MIFLYTVTSTKMAEMNSIFVLHVTFLRGKTMTKLLDSIMMTGLLFFLSPSRNLNNHQTDVPIYCHLNQGQRWNPFVVACDVFKRGNHDWAIRFQVFLIFDNVSHFPDLSKFSSSLSRTLINDLTYACIEVEPKMLRESAFTEPPVSLLHHICNIWLIIGGEGNIAAHRGDKLGESNCWQAPHSTQNPSPTSFLWGPGTLQAGGICLSSFFLIFFGLSLVKTTGFS